KSPKFASPSAGLENRRDPRLVPAGEIAWLLLSVPICALLAQALYDRRSVLLRLAPVDLDGNLWPAIALAWIATIGIGLVAGIMAVASWRRMSKLEAKLFLQDGMWFETRREQRRLVRWLVWLRRRRNKV